MKLCIQAISVEGQEHSLITDYIMKVGDADFGFNKVTTNCMIFTYFYIYSFGNCVAVLHHVVVVVSLLRFFKLFSC